MTRGAITVIMVAFALTMMLFVGVPSIEGVGEQVKTYDTIDQNMEGTTMIDNLYWAVFVSVPLIFLGGMMVWGVAWYLRRESFRGGL